MRMLIISILSLLFVGLNASLLMKDLPKNIFEVDEIITIEWNSEGRQPNDLIIIDLINDRPEVMIEPFVVIEDLFVKQKKYEWKIPRFLKSSGDYHLRVYIKNTQPPTMTSKAFSIVNPNPMRQSTLNLLEPTGSADGKKLESTCLIGEQCYVLWDYPDWAETAMPKRVDINLYGGDKLVMVLAVGVPVEAKSFLWRVPDNNAASLKLDNVHVVVSASGLVLRPMKPGESYYLASAGYPFKLETRAEREERRLSKPKPIDFTAPGPIQVTEAAKGEAFVDVPRPTYGGSGSNNNNPNNNNNNNNNNTSTSSSAAMRIESNLVSIGLAVIFLTFFALAF